MDSLDKLKRCFALIRGEVSALSARVDTLSKPRAVPLDGKDGVSPDVNKIIDAVVAQIPAPVDGKSPDVDHIVAEVLAKVPKPRDGRDALQVNTSDVAAIVLAKIPKPEDGEAGAAGAVGEAGRQGPKGDRGPKGDQGIKGNAGEAGKPGASITKVGLEKGVLAVWVDGVKNVIGKIPAGKLAPTSFVPSSVGGGGRKVVQQVTKDQPYINITITQNPANTYPVVGTNDVNLWPPATPQPLVGGNYEGYVKVGNLENNNNIDYTLTNGEDITFTESGRNRVDGFADFKHSANGSTIAFVFAVEVGGNYIFSQRPVKHRVPNGNDTANMAGEGMLSAQQGWKTSLWVASDNTGTVGVDTLSIIVAKIAEL